MLHSRLVYLPTSACTLLHNLSNVQSLYSHKTQAKLESGPKMDVHLCLCVCVHSYMPIWTSNVTGRHRGLKLKHRAGYRALTLQRMSLSIVTAPLLGQFYFSSSSVVSCTFSVICAHYARIRHSGVILTPRLPLCQISFLSHPPLLS